MIREFLTLRASSRVSLNLRASPAILPKTHPLLLCLDSYQFLYYPNFIFFLQQRYLKQTTQIHCR